MIVLDHAPGRGVSESVLPVLAGLIQTLLPCVLLALASGTNIFCDVASFIYRMAKKMITVICNPATIHGTLILGIFASVLASYVPSL